MFDRRGIFDPSGQPVVYTRSQLLRTGLAIGALLIMALGLWAIMLAPAWKAIVQYFK